MHISETLQHPIVSGGRLSGQKWTYLFLLAVSLPLLLFRLGTYPAVWFDEGYKLNAARTVAERGVYGTYTIEGYIPFDPGISSGPADVLPTALSIKLLGTGTAQARLVSVAFSLIAVAAFFSIAEYIYGIRIARFITLFALAFPALGDTGFLLIGRQILGEPAALAFILLGMRLWFESWNRHGWIFAVLAGLLMGVGLLSKTQIAIALLPTLLLVAAGRWFRYRRDLIRLFVPLVVSLMVVIGWMLVGSLNTPPNIRAENSTLLTDAIRSNLVTDLFDQRLDGPSLLIVVVIALGVVTSLWAVVRPHDGKPLITNQRWAKATLTVFAAVMLCWFVALSVGWPRYAYAGLVVALLLVGRLAWDIFQTLQSRIPDRNIYPAVIVALVLLAVITNIVPVLRYARNDDIHNVIEYINVEISRDVVIETWEWELSGLSRHWEYHHPDQLYLFQAIRQFSHGAETFALDYDLLQADPDYLVVGTFAGWTRIYQPVDIATHFEEVAAFGVYRVYQRIRP